MFRARNKSLRNVIKKASKQYICEDIGNFMCKFPIIMNGIIFSYSVFLNRKRSSKNSKITALNKFEQL